MDGSALWTEPGRPRDRRRRQAVAAGAAAGLLDEPDVVVLVLEVLAGDVLDDEELDDDELDELDELDEVVLLPPLLLRPWPARASVR